jgi:glutaredoxin
MMRSLTMQKPLFAPLLASLLMAFVGANALAQSVYRIVGPDGKVTFSDRPPADAASAQPARTANMGPAAANAALPLELRQVANRFPVTLYTGSDCAPCVSAKTLLVQRGVPFTERTVSTAEDIAALQRLSGNTSLPFGTVGGQQLAGFSDAEWTQYLDVAGYPKQSRLPANYRPPAATPLVAIQAPEPSAAASAPPARTATQRQRPPVPVNDGPTPSNPAGIRF